MNKKNKVILSIIIIILASLIIVSIILVKNILKEKRDSNVNGNNNNEINVEQNTNINSYTNADQNINDNYYANKSNTQNVIDNNITNKSNSNQNKDISTETATRTGLAEDAQTYGQETEATIEKYFSDKIAPRGISTLYGKYKGKNDKNDLFRSFKRFVDYIEVLSNDTNKLNDNEIRKYYANNKNTISDRLGQTEDEFYNFIKSINRRIYNATDFNYCEIDDSSYSDNGTYLTFSTNFTYKNSSLQVKVLFANEKGFEPEVIYQ